MPMFKRVTVNEDIYDLSELASEIWHESYSSMLPSEQINYMLNKFLSVPSMKKQIEDFTEFYIITKNNQHVGFFSFVLNDTIFLSKLYVKSNYRLQGHAKSVINYLKSYVRPIVLTVNVNNQRAINFYEKLGFRIVKPIKTDIGCGYFMDDYLMRYDQ